MNRTVIDFIFLVKPCCSLLPWLQIPFSLGLQLHVISMPNMGKVSSVTMVKYMQK